MYVKVEKGGFIPPINLEDIQGFIRQDDDYEIELISNLVQVASEYAETYMNRILQHSTVRVYLEKVNGGDFVVLPFGELDKVTIVSSNGTEIPNTFYNVNEFKNGILFKISSSDVIVTYTCGYKSPEDIPSPIKQAILMIANTMYEQREDEIADTGINSTPAIISSKTLMNPYWLRNWEY